MRSVPRSQRLCGKCPVDVVLPSRLSQPVILSLLQQLGVSLTAVVQPWKLEWLRAAALALEPSDVVIAPHVPGVLAVLQRTVDQLLRAPTSTPAFAALAVPSTRNDLRLLLHVLNSLVAKAPN